MSEDTLFPFVLAWIAIGGLVGVLIGKSRGRSEAGFFLGAIFGVIGWLLLAIGPDYRRRCAKCLGAVPDEAELCQHCGSSLA